MTKPKKQNKNYCISCHVKHVPPTGKKCKQQQVVQPNNSLLTDNSNVNTSDTDDRDTQDGAYVNKSEKYKFGLALLMKDGWKKHVQWLESHCREFKEWKNQSDFHFDFVPLADALLTACPDYIGPIVTCPIEQQKLVKATGRPNFLEARLPVKSELKVEEWEIILQNYWDKQLIDFIRFGFPLDFNRDSKLICDKQNHASAVQFPSDVEKYLEEEKRYAAIVGPFSSDPIQGLHYSPFMTRENPKL